MKKKKQKQKYSKKTILVYFIQVLLYYILFNRVFETE